MLGEMIKVLDHGFVQLVDVMGDDSAIVQAARVSFGKDGVQRTPEEDRGLIRYLMRNWHTTPFEMVEFKLHCKMPILTARQWIRHRTANVNEMSARYEELPEEFYVPRPERIRAQSTTNKQGSSDEIVAHSKMQSEEFADEASEAFEHYHGRLAIGMAKELARINLPLSTYTRWYWKCDLHNIFHFLRLRLDQHAQEEIRVYAQAMAQFVKWRCPVAWEAFEDYRLNGMSLSAQEVNALRAMIAPDLPLDGDHLITNKREADEFRAKLRRVIGG